MDPPDRRKPEIDACDSLELCLRRQIETHGPIAFSEFMRTALYEPALGYYTSGPSPWGPDGDYVTAPQVHPALGIALARLAAELDAALECPDPFTVAELGSGDGRLLRALLESMQRRHVGTFARLRIVSAEAGEARRRHQAETLPAPPRGLQLCDDATRLPEGLDIRGMVYSNELLDSLPVERLTLRRGELLQSFVVASGDRLTEQFRSPVCAPALEHLRRNEIVLREGQVAETCLGVAPCVAGIARALKQGIVLTIDYGHETVPLYGPSRHTGTLLCQHRFRLHDDPLWRPGQQDITAHVDFGNLRRCGREQELVDGELCSLRVFLIGMGIAEEPHPDPEMHLRLRHLLFSEIGDTHKVLLQSKNLALDSLRFGRARLEPC